MFSRRTTELLLLAAATPPVLLVFALVDTQQAKAFSASSLFVPGALLAVFVVAHVALRRFAPNADPALLPVTYALSGIGLAIVTRLDSSQAASQVVWLFASVAVLILTLVLVPSLETLARYKYTLMVSGLVLLLLPAVIGREINGAKLWIRFGSVGFQPGEVAKILIVLFLAAYLAENRELLSISTRRVLGMRFPEPRTLGPLLLMWAVSLLILVLERDLGSSLLFFAIFLVMLYAATGRPAYVAVGLVLFGAGATVAYFLFGHVRVRVDIWLHPFADAAGRGYQLVQSLFALAAGGLTGTGLGMGLPTRIPFVSTDFVFSAIGEELGLLGGAAIVLLFLVFAIRGLATAARAKTDMAAFTAVGLVAAITIQAFVIVGGVTRLIPLTGVTLPFISYGGSSLVSSFIALALLLRAGDEGTGSAVEMQTTSADLGVLGRVALGRRLTTVTTALAMLMALLIVNLTWIQVVEARALQNNPANTRNLAEQARAERGSILTADDVVLAGSRPTGRTFTRVYPEGEFASNVVGYYSVTYGRAGIEASENDVLAGGRSGFSSWADVIDAATGHSVPGNDVVLTLDSRVQKAAEKALRGHSGACLVLDPRSGALLAAATAPGYDPAKIDDDWDKLNTDSSAPLVDRGRNALYPPGSTFKIVTLTGALSSGLVTPQTKYIGPGRMRIGGAPVTNFEGGSYGPIDVITATTRSVNTVYAQMAVDLGPEALVRQANAFGFGKELGLEIGEKVSLMPDPSEMTMWETAWAGVGQPVGEHASPAGPQATVLQMALVSAGIANNGVVMRPYVVGSVRDNLGQTTGVTSAQTLTTATNPQTAATVNAIMRRVVTAGSGYRAAIKGVKVAGKTGTAEVGKGKPTNAWFIAFAPAEKPTVALAIMIEGGGVGGRVAAPAAKPVLEAALRVQEGK